MSHSDYPAPIALFTFHRPEHTERTLRALQQNDLAQKSHLHVFCDGPRTADDNEAVLQVRKIVRQESWCGQVTVHERQTNAGLATSIREGISQMLDHHDRVIVLEDDIETSPGFLLFMNEALEMYADEPRVMNISGYLPETSYQWRLPETFFLRLMACWGWATWKRAWQYARWDSNELLNDLANSNQTLHFDMDGSYRYSQQLERNRDGAIQTWAVFWAATCHLNAGLSLFPRRSLIRNTGLDGSGENCHAGQDVHQHYRCAEKINVDRISVQESSIGRKYYKAFYTFGRDSRVQRKVSQKFAKFRNRLLQKVPEFVKEPIRNIAGSEHPFGLALSDQKRLSQTPRFCTTSVSLFGREITVVDAASFLASHKEIFVQQIYQLQCESETPVIIDAGANIGLASIFLKRQYPEARITAIEADAQICVMLATNLAAYGFAGIDIVEGAVWDSNEDLRFHGNHADAGRVSDDGPVVVKGIRLRDQLEGQHIDFLKMDIEGAEIKVLRDCESVLTGVQKIFVEYHSCTAEPQSLSELLSLLERSGFRYYIQQTGVHSAHALVNIEQQDGFDLQLNIFAVRKKPL